MKITDRFIGDHKTFRKLLREIDALAASDVPDQKRLVRFVELFNDHLLLHDWGEKTFFYSAVAAKAGTPPLTTDYMRRLDEEHAHIDVVGRRLEDEARARPVHPLWKASYEEFKRALMDHMNKEEGELFPLSERLLGAPALEEISKDLERRRSEAPKIRLHSPF